MPKEYERLKRDIITSGRKKHKDWGSWSKERKDAYVYVTLRKAGWVRGKGGHMVKK